LDPIEKALKLRKSLPLKSKDPFWAFHSRLQRSAVVMRIVEQHSKSNTALYEARRQYVVALCAAFEIYWRDFIKVTLDRYHPREGQLKNLRTYKFSFWELQQILGHRLTLGELVSAAFTFQGTAVVNTVAHDIFNFDLFGILAAKRFKITVDFLEPRNSASEQTLSHTIEGTQVLKSRIFIERCFTIRHETVHDTGVRFRPSKTTVGRMAAAMNLFNLIASLVFEQEVEKNCQDKLP